MEIWSTAALILLIELTGPDHQTIHVNPVDIVSIRNVRSTEHFYPGAQCILHMTDGKPIIVIETCDTVRKMIEEAEQ